MQGGVFVTLYDEESLKLYLNRGIYGFLMKPVFEDKPSTRSKHYAALADYACNREGSYVFFFMERKVVYGGKIYGNKDCGSFYLNGNTSPLGKKVNAELFWDESKRYISTEKEGVFKLNQVEKAQPFIFQFEQDENTGKYISSDDLYYELGSYPYPLPSNSMQGMSFCTLTPGEVNVLLELTSKEEKFIDYQKVPNINKINKETLFNKDFVNLHEDQYINEAQLEFTILSSLEPLKKCFLGNYILCRQVPISPFKPMNMDRADICLYDIDSPIKDGTIPNIIIEVKTKKANFHAYNQVTRYLKWIDKITDKNEFKELKVFIIAESFTKIKKDKVDTKYENKIKMYSLEKNDFIELS